MTTLELAEKIIEAIDNPTVLGIRKLQVIALFRVMYEHDSWFCRNPTGDEWHDEAEERYEAIDPVQLEFFT